jgi:hypothetical protein
VTFRASKIVARTPKCKEALGVIFSLSQWSFREGFGFLKWKVGGTACANVRVDFLTAPLPRFLAVPAASGRKEGVLNEREQRNAD